MHLHVLQSFIRVGAIAMIMGVLVTCGKVRQPLVEQVYGSQEVPSEVGDGVKTDKMIPAYATIRRGDSVYVKVRWSVGDSSSIVAVSPAIVWDESSTKLIVNDVLKVLAVLTSKACFVYRNESSLWTSTPLPDSIANHPAWGHYSSYCLQRDGSMLVGLQAGEFGGGLIRIRVTPASTAEIDLLADRHINTIRRISSGGAVVAGSLHHLRHWESWIGVVESDTLRIVDWVESSGYRDTSLRRTNAMNMPRYASITDVCETSKGLLVLFPTSGVYRLETAVLLGEESPRYHLVQKFTGDVCRHSFTSGRFLDSATVVLSIPSGGSYRVRLVENTAAAIPPEPQVGSP